MKLFLSVLILSTFGFVTHGQTAALSLEASVSEFEVNGLKVIFKRRTGSSTVSSALFVRGGVRNQTAQNAGIENLTLSTAAQASKKYPRDVLRKELARTGTIIGPGATFDYGVISMISTSQNFPRSWDAFTDVIFNPTFAIDDVERVKSSILAGLRNESASPDGALGSLEEKIVYAGHPYANSPNGTVDSVMKLSAADLRAYHQQMLQGRRLLLVIVGDIDPAEIRKMVSASFARLPKGDYKEMPLAELEFTKSSVDIVQRSLTTNYVKGIFGAPSLKNPDYYAMRVAIAILQGRVYREVRTKRNLSYAPNADMDNRQANSANIYVTAVDANQAIRVMLDEISKMAASGIEEDEFEGVPGYFLTTYYIDHETNAAQAAELGQYELVGGGWRKSFEFLDRIRGVKPEDIQTVAKKYIRNLRFVVVGNPSDIDRSVFLGN